MAQRMGTASRYFPPPAQVFLRGRFYFFMFFGIWWGKPIFHTECTEKKIHVVRLMHVPTTLDPKELFFYSLQE
jgi:hypothetical protein